MCMPHQSTKKAMTKRVRRSQLPGERKSQAMNRKVMEPDADFVDARVNRGARTPDVPTKSFWQRLFGQ